MQGPILDQLEKLITARAGLQIREQELPILQKTLNARLQTLKMADGEEYLRLLTTAGAASEAEWKRLFILLTNQESYFFRDRGQLAVIRDNILPELIRRNSSRRSLRIWSAGCSTGEEPYSLAIMLDELLPLRDAWNVQIFGTDLSEAALERARRGVYGAWSFRTADSALQGRYFRAKADKWEIVPRLREAVTFRSSNLLNDEFPSQSSGLHDIDLIVCRNVFIYFEREAIGHVLRKFHATLRGHGCLITGHAELHSLSIQGFAQRTFPQTIVYQRSNAETSHAANSTTDSKPRLPSPATMPSPSAGGAAAGVTPYPVARAKSTLIGSAAIPPVTPTRARDTLLIPASTTDATPRKVLSSTQPDGADTLLPAAIDAMRLRHHEKALEKLSKLLEHNADHFEALCLSAQARANLGHLKVAEELCRRATALNSLASLPYHLRARIAEENGQSEDAKAHLKTTIYLHPGGVWAYLELAAIYEHEGDLSRAAQMRRGAIQVLSGLAAEALVPLDEHAIEERMTVAELLSQLQAATK